MVKQGLKLHAVLLFNSHALYECQVVFLLGFPYITGALRALAKHSSVWCADLWSGSSTDICHRPNSSAAQQIVVSIYVLLLISATVASGCTNIHSGNCHYDVKLFRTGTMTYHPHTGLH
jgi:hypothetical protein